MGAPRPRSSDADARRTRRLPYVVLAIAAVVAVAAALSFRMAVRERDTRRFDNAIESTEDRIRSRIDTYVAVLLATRALFAARDDAFDRPGLRAFIHALELQRRYPGIQGLGYARAFRADQQAEVEDELHRAGFPEVRVWPAHPRGQLTSIVLLEPPDLRNLAALGFDMSTEPTRREAMERARDSGQPAASGPVTLVQEIDADKQPGFLLYVPVYRGGGVPGTVEERRAALLGYVYSAFRMEDLLRGIFGSERAPRVGFAVRDLDASGTLLHRSAARRADPLHRASSTIDIAGRTWALDFWTLPAFELGSGRWAWPYVLVAGALVSLVLFALARRQAHAAEQLRLHGQVLDRMRVAAEDASRTKDEFLAMLGHELRNPLAPIVTALELLDRRGRLASDRELAIIARQVGHLQRLVDDLLDVAAITRGKVKLTPRRLDAAAVVGAAVELVRPLVDDKRHQLRVDVEPGLFLDADEARLVQVLGNLLNNAAKYTPAGGHLEVSARRDREQVVLRVRDDGAGIEPDQLERLFGLFEQGERGVDRAEGGLGVGLAVVRGLVQLHGGTVVGHSEGRGRGAEFVVRLPAAPAETAEASAAAGAAAADERPAGPGRRVLIVDDNVDAADLLAELVRLAGHHVDVAYAGDQALERAAAGPYDVAVLDIGLPGMDGYQLARRLRAEPRGPRTLVAVTGYGQERDRTAAREAGFDHHLVKPIDARRLVELIAAPSTGPARS